jgi:hypothetical protein
MRYATLLALATSATALPMDLPLVSDLTKGLSAGGLTQGVGVKRGSSIDCSLESSIGLLECNDVDVPVDVAVLARNTKIECEIDGVISAANCNDIDIPITADVLKRTEGHGPPTGGAAGDSIDCSLESAVGLLECNDIDVPIEVSVLKRESSEGHEAPAAGDEIMCEVDGALISALNCNDIDIPVTVDVAKRSEDQWKEAEAPASKPSKKGSSEEEEKTSIECESDGLISALNCNDIDIPVTADVLRS